MGQVRVGGGLRREIHVDLNLEKLRALDLSVAQVVNTIRNENLNRPVGPVKEGRFDVLLRTSGEFDSVDQILNVALTSRDGIPIYVRDIARSRIPSRYPPLRGSQWSSRAAADHVQAVRVKHGQGIRCGLGGSGRDPPRLSEHQDREDHGHRGLHRPLRSATSKRPPRSAGVLAVLGAAALPAQPLEHPHHRCRDPDLGDLDVLADVLQRFHPEHVSFGGLALGVGMLVDNAIVVLENIYRHREEGAVGRMPR